MKILADPGVGSVNDIYPTKTKSAPHSIKHPRYPTVLSNAVVIYGQIFRTSVDRPFSGLIVIILIIIYFDIQKKARKEQRNRIGIRKHFKSGL